MNHTLLSYAHSNGYVASASALSAPANTSSLSASPLAPPQERAQLLGVADSIQPHHTILNGFLIFLYCLHVYW